MLLVIFGAGASYDSAPRHDPRVVGADRPWRPPLTDRLFVERPEFGRDITNYPRILPLIAQLAESSTNESFEATLTRLADEADQYPARQNALVAFRYFLQQLIWECDYKWQYECYAITNYLGLLDRIERWRAASGQRTLFLTFNYDRLFEYAASHFVSNGNCLYENLYTTIDSYIQNERFPLIKPHGSIDWGYRVNTDMPVVQESNEHVWRIAHEVISQFAALDVSTEVTKTEDRPPKPQAGHAFIPAIAIPLDKKTTFACPPSHLDFFDRCVGEVNAILTVGWRGTEEHFLNRLRANLQPGVRLQSVSGSRASSDQTIDQLKSASLAFGSTKAFDGGFSRYVSSAEADSFLRDALQA